MVVGVVTENYRVWARCVVIKCNDGDRQDGEYLRGESMRRAYFAGRNSGEALSQNVVVGSCLIRGCSPRWITVAGITVKTGKAERASWDKVPNSGLIGVSLLDFRGLETFPGSKVLQGNRNRIVAETSLGYRKLR